VPSIAIEEIRKNRDGTIHVLFSDRMGYLYGPEQVDEILARVENDFTEWMKMTLIATALTRNPQDVKEPAEDGTTPGRTKMTTSWDLSSKSIVYRSDDGERKREELDLEDPKVKTV